MRAGDVLEAPGALVVGPAAAEGDQRPRLGVAVHQGVDAGLAGGGVHQAAVHAGVLEVAVVAPQPRVAGDLQVRVDVPGEAAGQHVRAGAVAVGVELLEGLARHAGLAHRQGVDHARARTDDQAVVGDAVVLLVQVVERERLVGAEAEAHRGGQTPAVALHPVAVHHAGGVGHEVEAHGRGGVDLVVGVHRAAVVVAVADRAVHADEVARQRGRLGDGVDRPARGAAAEHGARGPLQHLDLLVVEAVARVDAEVAQAVDVDVVVGVLAADLELVARQGAALADGDGDARHVAQALLQGGDVLLADELLRHDVDHLRRVLHRLGDGGGEVQRVLARVVLGGDHHLAHRPGRVGNLVGEGAERRQGGGGGEDEEGGTAGHRIHGETGREKLRMRAVLS